MFASICSMPPLSVSFTSELASILLPKWLHKRGIHAQDVANLPRTQKRSVNSVFSPSNTVPAL